MTHGLADLISSQRCALAVAHPGHEIRVFGWMAANRPTISVLTDGSGHKGVPRLQSSAKLLADIGVPIGPIFGAYSDRQIYAHVLAKNADPFLRLADRLAGDWVKNRIDIVLGDACEGAIMAHDLWRAVIDRAVQLAARRRGCRIRNMAFSLKSDPRTSPADRSSEKNHQNQLHESIWKRKILAAENYVGIQSEVQDAFSVWGKAAFRYETMWELPCAINSNDWVEKPKYELHGEAQVVAGVYEQVVRYREHVRPILEALQTEESRGARAA